MRVMMMRSLRDPASCLDDGLKVNHLILCVPTRQLRDSPTGRTFHMGQPLTNNAKY